MNKFNPGNVVIVKRAWWKNTDRKEPISFIHNSKGRVGHATACDDCEGNTSYWVTFENLRHDPPTYQLICSEDQMTLWIPPTRKPIDWGKWLDNVHHDFLDFIQRAFVIGVGFQTGAMMQLQNPTFTAVDIFWNSIMLFVTLVVLGALICILKKKRDPKSDPWSFIPKEEKNERKN